MRLIVGQVLWLKLPFGKTDEISQIYHPYLILDINNYGVKLVEVGQLDSENDHPWEILRGMKIPIDDKNPQEKAIYQPSYLQTDRKIKIEYFDELTQYLDTEEPLSNNKLNKIIDSYYDKRSKYGSDDFRDMYFSKEEIVQLNPPEDWADANSYRTQRYQR